MQEFHHYYHVHLFQDPLCLNVLRCIIYHLQHLKLAYQFLKYNTPVLLLRQKAAHCAPEILEFVSSLDLKSRSP